MTVHRSNGEHTAALVPRGAIILLSIFVLGTFAAAGRCDASPQDDLHGGHFLLAAKTDSLGYDEYRRLPTDYQLERRMEAKRWARRAREENPGSGSLDLAATAVGLCPYLPEAWVVYALRLNELGRYVDSNICLDHTERTLRFEPDKRRRRELTGDYHRLRAIVAYNQGDPSLCVEHSAHALEIHQDDDLRLLRARALSELGRYDEARALLRKFSDRSPAYARSLAVLGLVEMDQSRYEEAADAFQRAYKYGMRGPIFENDRGRLALARERYGEAVEHFQSAIASLPDFMEARNNLAVAYRRAGRLDEARLTLEDAVALRRDYAPVQFNLAEVYRQQLDEATDAAERAELVALAFEKYTEALAWGYDPAVVIERRAELALFSEDLEQAEADLLAMTQDSTIDGRVLHLLGRVKKEQGQLDIALKLMKMAEANGYAVAELYADLGEVQLRTGDLEGARRSLEKAVELRDDLIVTRVNLSIVYSQLGELDAAEEVLQEAEALDPESELVQTQREALRRMREQH